MNMYKDASASKDLLAKKSKNAQKYTYFDGSKRDS